MVMIGVVVLAHQIDLLFEGKFAVKSLTIGILLSSEGLSILENASICGVPISEKLKNILEQYKEKNNSFSSEFFLKFKINISLIFPFFRVHSL